MTHNLWAINNTWKVTSILGCARQEIIKDHCKEASNEHVCTQEHFNELVNIFTSRVDVLWVLAHVTRQDQRHKNRKADNKLVSLQKGLGLILAFSFLSEKCFSILKTWKQSTCKTVLSRMHFVRDIAIWLFLIEIFYWIFLLVQV